MIAAFPERVGQDVLRARPQSHCFACGPDHPNGLRLQFETTPNGVATAWWTPVPQWQGFEGIVHGGIVGTVLDEAMSKAVAASGDEALTGELRIRFRKHIAPGETLQLRGKVTERRKRLLRAEATLTGVEGEERAHAWASFLALRATRKER